MKSNQVVKILVVLACIVLVAALLYVGGASMTQMIRAHMGG